MNKESLIAAYKQFFSGAPKLYRAPGRINFIGEHTDYNEGFVMPSAINYATYIAAGKRSDRRLAVRSLEFGEIVEFSLDDVAVPTCETHHWSDYVRGVAAILDEHPKLNLSGANLLIAGEVPFGSGLSSSAALEVSTACALIGTERDTITDLEIARACQRAENEYAGARCGIMDQYASVFGEAGRAILLDCRTLEHQSLDLPASFEIVVCNTMVKHALAGGEYNTRRGECEEAVRYLRQKSHREIRSLRDVTPEELKQFEGAMPATIFRRALHIVTENDRVLRAAEALRRQDLKIFGELMLASHRSLKDDYEVSCAELDLMIASAEKLPGFYGGRMMGGGFGGCTINLVETNSAKQFKAEIAAAYEKSTNIVPEIYICRTADGAGELR